jgi:hypothetical protein
MLWQTSRALSPCCPGPTTEEADQDAIRIVLERRINQIARPDQLAPLLLVYLKCVLCCIKEFDVRVVVILE